jgi:hypothetical protein
MKRRLIGLAKVGVLAAVGLSLGCAAQNPKSSTNEIAPELQQYVLPLLPASVEHETYLDFGGKVQLLGYDVSPKDVAPPGSKISLTLYWQRTGSLAEGWGLFTHILDATGRQIAQKDSSGPLRAVDTKGVQALGPSRWEIGKIYVDPLEFDVPTARQRGTESEPLRTSVITLAVGVWKNSARLDVIGGSSDKFRRGLVTNLKTGVKPEALQQEDKGSEKTTDG